MVYENNTQINTTTNKSVDALTASLMKIKYGNAFIFIENPKALIEILSKKIAYDKDKNKYTLTLERYRDSGIYRFIHNYKMFITDNEFNFDVHKIEMNKKPGSNELSFKMFDGVDVVDDKIIMTMPIFIIDILNIVKNFAMQNRWK